MTKTRKSRNVWLRHGATVLVTVGLLGLMPVENAAGAATGAGVSSVDVPLVVPNLEPGPKQNADGTYTAVAVKLENGRPQFVPVHGSTPEAAKAGAMAVPGAVDVAFNTAVSMNASDPHRSVQWDLDYLKMPQLTSRPDAAAQVVAVIDTGILASHEDWPVGTVLCALGHDYTTEGISTDGCVDPHGHGTHVAGTIAAASANGLGIEGMAPPVKILPLRALDSGGSGDAMGVSQAIIDATDKGATVINLSLSGPYSSLFDSAVAYANDNNVVVVAAVGNNGNTGNEPQWPASSPGAIGVGAIDETGTLTYFSVTGSMVDVVAPGTNIASLGSSSNSNYVYRSGTSMAAPHVAALAAMIRAKDGTLTDDQVASVITSTADDAGVAGRDDLYGYGVMNVLKAVADAPSAPSITSATPFDNSVTLEWTTPADNGAAITGYSLTAVPTNGGPTVTSNVGPTASPASLGGLGPGTAYDITVRAINGAGTSTATAPTSLTTTGDPAPLVISTDGYRFLASDGTVSAHSESAWYGDANGLISGTAVTIASTSTGSGYWIASSKGEVVTFGDAAFHGSMVGHRLNAPVINMAVTPTGNGYWLLAQDGGVFTFGDAGFFGSTGNIRLNQPAVGMTPTSTGAGYWFVASDGGIFAFGDAAFHGSMGAVRLNKPVVGMTVSTTGNGYRMVASDGGIFSFGDANFYGSLGANPPASPVRAMQPTKSNSGYWMVSEDGSTYSFGDAGFFGRPYGRAIVAMTY